MKELPTNPINKRNFMKKMLYMISTGLFFPEKGLKRLSYAMDETPKYHENAKRHYEIIINQTGRGNIRKQVFSELKEKHDIHIFGKALDDIVSSINDYYVADFARHSYFSVPVMDNFLAGNMSFDMVITKKDFLIDIYQNYDSKNILLAEEMVALGGRCKDHQTEKIKNFETPSGRFYIKRIVKDPYWYPPKWSKHEEPIKPGSDNPFGRWMAELYTTNIPGNYKFHNPDDSTIKIHSTDNPDSIGHCVTHGCIRLHPEVAEDLFPAILEYTRHGTPVKTYRGEIRLLEKPFPVRIKEA